jgi:transcription antitermination factor NusG
MMIHSFLVARQQFYRNFMKRNDVKLHSNYTTSRIYGGSVLNTEENRVMDQAPVLPWYALKVRTNGESKPYEALILKGFEAFLPTFIDVRKYSDRLKKVPAALFPGYLFCRLDAEHRLPILSTPGVESIVGPGGVPHRMEEEEITVIRRVLQTGAAVPWPYLKEGDRVRVQFGSLQGVEGTLIKVRGIARLVISIHMLQRSISMEIDREWVRPL